MVVLTIGFALLLSFAVVFVARQYSSDVAAKYPAVNCEPYYTNYPGEQLEPFAIQEYTLNTAAEAADKPTQYAGYLSCFCQQQVASGVAKDATYPMSDGSEVAICQQYWKYQWFLLTMTNVITGFVVVVNTILSELTIRMITWIGYDTQSEMMTKITNGIFIAQFFNTGLIYLLVNANFADTFPSLGSIFRGPYLDYDPGWYSVVGYLLVYTMIFNAIFPPIMQAIADI